MAGIPCPAWLLLLDDELHEQTVVPAFAFGIPLVPAHHSDWLEAGLFVGADRGHVVGSRVDRDPVVAALLDQLSGDSAYRLLAEAATVQRRAEEEVDASVLVRGFVLL